MFCEEFERRCQVLLDRRQSPDDDEQLQSHALACESCRLDLVAQDQLLSGLGHKVSPVVPADFSRQVVARLNEELQREDSRLTDSRPAADANPQRMFVGILAASVLLVLAPAYFLARDVLSGVSVNSPHLAVRDVTDSPTALPVSNAAMVAREAAQQVKLEIPAVVASSSSDLPSDAHTPGDFSLETLWRLDELRDNLSFVSMEQLESVDQITEGFRPIATSLQSAFNVLRRSLPVGRDEQQAPKSTPDTSRILDQLWIG